jgi:probable HAF family extracellular repeat protein
MALFLSLIRAGLVAALLCSLGIASALYAQTITTFDDARSAYSILRQKSGDSLIIIPIPHSTLGKRMILNQGTHNATTNRANDDYFINATKVRSRASDRVAITHRYFVTDPGTLGGTQSFAYGINNSGQVVGFSWTAGDASGHSFLYSNGRMTDLYPLNSQDLVTVGPTDINDAGQVASGLVVGGVYTPAVLDSRTGDLTLLGSLGGVTPFGFSGVATSINTFGDAVGYSYIDSVNRHAFLYSHGAMTDIGSFGGYSGALSINDEGTIVGFASDRDNGSAHAFVYSHGAMTDIDPVGLESSANDVNNRGQVVGEFLTADQSSFHAFLYSEGVFNDLGSPESPETVAFAINNQQQIVGTTLIPYDATCSNGPCIKYKEHAFLYEGGKLADLNTLIPSDSGWELSWAFGINDRGQIAGYGLVNDNFRAFLLTPATSKQQCKNSGWKNVGFKNQGQCIQFVNTGK